MSHINDLSSANSQFNQKILSLDVDGVLNSEVYSKSLSKMSNSVSRFDPDTVKMIKKLVKEFSFKIVVSSTWRYGAIDRLMHELKRNKLLQYLHQDWFTPVIHPAHRGEEIIPWLHLHPEVDDYIIIDDDDNIPNEQLSRFVKTDLHFGMTEKHYDRVRAIFSPVESIEE